MKWFLKITELPDYPHWSLMGAFGSYEEAAFNKQSYLDVEPTAKISAPFEAKESEVERPPAVQSIYTVGGSNRKLWSDGHVEEVP